MCIHPSIRPSIHPCMHACMHACIHTYIHAYTHILSHTSDISFVDIYTDLTCMHAFMHEGVAYAYIRKLYLYRRKRIRITHKYECVCIHAYK